MHVGIVRTERLALSILIEGNIGKQTPSTPAVGLRDRIGESSEMTWRRSICRERSRMDYIISKISLFTSCILKARLQFHAHRRILHFHSQYTHPIHQTYFLGSRLGILALFASPSNTNSLTNCPVAHEFWIPQHVCPVASSSPSTPVCPITGPPPPATLGR